ncbi:MAG: YIP1 family protein [Gammaproteobacteria bacterium]|nr:MAG: YIP1 family protein [Gammaproteobacteria bacterium]
MVIAHVIGIFTNPRAEWEKIRDEDCGLGQCLLKHVMVMAAIPAVSGYIGTTQVGWKIGASGTHYLTNTSAGMIAILTYLAMVAGVIGIGAMIQWMSQTYGEPKSLNRSVILAAYVATPLFLVGFMLLSPILWLNMILGLPALAYSVYLLYSGVPIVMEISEEKGFLYASAILGLGLVALVAILATTVILWAYGFGPTLTS